MHTVFSPGNFLQVFGGRGEWHGWESIVKIIGHQRNKGKNGIKIEPIIKKENKYKKRKKENTHNLDSTIHLIACNRVK